MVPLIVAMLAALAFAASGCLPEDAAQQDVYDGIEECREEARQIVDVTTRKLAERGCEAAANPDPEGDFVTARDQCVDEILRLSEEGKARLDALELCP